MGRVWLDPDRIFVPLSEPLGRFAGMTVTGVIGPITRGLVLRQSTAEFTEAVFSAHFDGNLIGVDFEEDGLGASDRPLSVVEFQARFPNHRPSCQSMLAATVGPGRITDREGVVLSGVRSEVFVFGGFENGAPRSSAWLFGGTRGAWQEIPLSEGERPGDVVAAVYHMEDGHYYEVERPGPRLLMRRFSPKLRRFETVGEWPPAWHSFDSYWLVSGAAGELLFIATKEHSSAVARLLVDEPSGNLRFAGMHRMSRAILTRPIGSLGKAVVVTDPEPGASPKSKGPPANRRSLGPLRALLPYSQFSDSPGGWRPSLGSEG
jgi:hypothetical protein